VTLVSFLCLFSNLCSYGFDCINLMQVLSSDIMSSDVMSSEIIHTFIKLDTYQVMYDFVHIT
jgi:hypothetical protein